MINLFKPLSICWGIISLVLIILPGGLLAISYSKAVPATDEMHVINGSNLPTSIYLNGTDFQFDISYLWLLFSVAALNLATVILIYFYNSSKNKRNPQPSKGNK